MTDHTNTEATEDPKATEATNRPAELNATFRIDPTDGEYFVDIDVELGDQTLTPVDMGALTIQAIDAISRMGDTEDGPLSRVALAAAVLRKVIQSDDDTITGDQITEALNLGMAE